MGRVAKAVKKYGMYGTFIKGMNKVTGNKIKLFNNANKKFEKKYNEKVRRMNQPRYDFIEEKMKSYKYKYVFVFYPYVEWNLPTFQRPQQIALALSKREDVLYLFCTTNSNYDHIENLYEEINDNLYVVTDYDFVCSVETYKRVIHLYSADTVSHYIEVDKAKQRGDKILYEYIDEIHDDITKSTPGHYIAKHKKILNHEDCYIIATADKLYDDVKKVRKTKYALSTNGVNVDDFNKKNSLGLPDDLERIKKDYEKVICYYGSLAKWFDYDLLKECANAYPNYAFILIGLEYDDAFKKSKVLDIKNVFYLGKVEYKELYRYSRNVDLLTIPFLINEITESTSPVKLFEYMASEVPILTTNMKECKKYKSVIVAKNHEDYINKIPTTIELINNKDYVELLMKEAKENTWDQKANVLIDLLDGKVKK